MAQLNATAAGPISTNPFASLRDALTSGRASSSGGRISSSGGPTAGRTSDSGRADKAGTSPTRQPQASASAGREGAAGEAPPPPAAGKEPSAGAGPTAMARLHRGSLSGGLTAASKLDGPGASPMRTRTREGRQSTSGGRFSMSGEAPASPVGPPSAPPPTAGASGGGASPLHHAILSRIERRWSNTGSASMVDRTSTSDAPRSSSLGRLSESGGPAGRQSLSGSAGPPSASGVNPASPSPLGASTLRSGPGVLASTTFAQPTRTANLTGSKGLAARLAGPGTALPDPSDPPQRRSISGSVRGSLSGREDDLGGFGAGAGRSSKRVSLAGGARQDFEEALAATLAGVGGNKVPGAGPPNVRRALADRVS